MSQCVVPLQLWSTTSKASSLAHLWSMLPGTCINWARNWIVVFISSSRLLASLSYGLLGKCSKKAYKKTFFSFFSSLQCGHVTDEKQLSLTSDTMRLPIATIAFQDTKEIQTSKRSLLKSNNRPKSLIFLWRIRQQYKSITCWRALLANAPTQPTQHYSHPQI